MPNFPSVADQPAGARRELSPVLAAETRQATTDAPSVWATRRRRDGAIKAIGTAVVGSRPGSNPELIDVNTFAGWRQLFLPVLNMGEDATILRPVDGSGTPSDHTRPCGAAKLLLIDDETGHA